MNKLYIPIIIVFIAHFRLAPCYGQSNSQTEQFRLLYYGKPNPDPTEVRILDFVGQRWGIEFIRVAGCNVSKELADSVKIQNDKVDSLIAKKYGIDWNIKFDEELKLENENEIQVIALIDNSDFIREWKDKMQKDSTITNYDLFPIPKTTKYKASIKGLSVKRRENKTYYNLIVDHKDKTVIIE